MNKLQANLCLVCVTLLWSTEVVIFACIPADVSPFATTCITSLVGGLLLLAMFWKRAVAELRKQGRLFLRRCLFLCVLNCAYNLMYQFGLDYFDVSTGAFTVSMTAVVLPVILITLRRSVSRRTWVSVVLVLVGIFTALGGSLETLSPVGLALMLAGAVVRAVFIVKLNDCAQDHDPVALSASIALIVGGMSWVLWFITDPLTFVNLDFSVQAIASLAIYSYFIVAFAQTINIFAQRRATAADSTIIYSLEIVFSVIWGSFLPATLVDPVALTPHIVIGCLCILFGSLIDIVHVGWFDKLMGEKQSTESSHATFVQRKLETAWHALSIKRSVRTFVLLLVVYMVLMVPFKVLAIIPGFTDIRPISMLQPVFGIFFGVPGCLAFAVGNLIGDAMSDSLRWSSVAGFVANFVAPYLMYLAYARLSKRPFALRAGKQLLYYTVLVVVAALATVVMIAPSIALWYPDVDIALFVESVMANQVAFPVLIGIPLMALMQEELGFKPLLRPRGDA